MRLTAALQLYELHRGIADSSAYQMRRTVALFSKYLNRDALVSDLDGDVVSGWLRWLEQSHSAYTVHGHRGKLLCIWRECADRDLVPPPHRVRRVRKPEPCPIAWTIDELRRILDACGRIEGAFPNRAPRSLYLSTLVKACWETGLRRSDVWALRRDRIRSDGTVILRQEKTAQPHFPQIRPDTIAGIAALPGTCPLACPYRSTGVFYKLWRQVILKAGVPHGALQQIRRTAATYVALEHPQSVQAFLGHRSASMAKHYVDRSIAQQRPAMPPNLDPDVPDVA